MSFYDTYCPYCDEGVNIDHDDGYGYDEDVMFQQECGSCGKTFAYTSSMSWNYDPVKAPCMNGGEHKWRAMSGHPKEHFASRERCEYCDEERRVTPKDA